jgi:hypothetical protein
MVGGNAGNVALRTNAKVAASSGFDPDEPTMSASNTRPE